MQTGSPQPCLNVLPHFSSCLHIKAATVWASSPISVCSRLQHVPFYSEIKPRPGTAESPLTCTTMSRFVLSQWNRPMSTVKNDATVMTCLFQSSAFLFVWREQRSLFILHCRTKYYHKPNWIKQSSCLSCWGSLSLEIEENREGGKEKPKNGPKWSKKKVGDLIFQSARQTLVTLAKERQLLSIPDEVKTSVSG